MKKIAKNGFSNWCCSLQTQREKSVVAVAGGDCVVVRFPSSPSSSSSLQHQNRFDCNPQQSLDWKKRRHFLLNLEVNSAVAETAETVVAHELVRAQQNSKGCCWQC